MAMTTPIRMKDPEVLYTYFEECKLRPESSHHPVLCSIDLTRTLPSLHLPHHVDEDAQAQERAQLLSGQLEQTRLDVPFASEKDKKIVQIDHEEGKFVGGGNLGFLRQIYFGRLVSFWLYGFLSHLDTCILNTKGDARTRRHY
jgi:hypothetical protein